MSTGARDVTFSLHEDILTAMAGAVDQGAAADVNAFVEHALLRELREVRRQSRRLAWEVASRDPLFLKDIQDVEAEFDSADRETAGSIG